jgi:hypothetical protein
MYAEQYTLLAVVECENHDCCYSIVDAAIIIKDTKNVDI